MKNITFDEWEDEFKPIKNHINPGQGHTFETYGQDHDFVRQFLGYSRIWTIVEGDEGTYLIFGYHWINRLGYLIAQKAPTEEYADICLT